VDYVLNKAMNQAKDPKQIEQKDLDLPDGFKQYSTLILKGENS
jgi:hypothetical protein